jgi:hypothetical protein
MAASSVLRTAAAPSASAISGWRAARERSGGRMKFCFSSRRRTRRLTWVFHRSSWQGGRRRPAKESDVCDVDACMNVVPVCDMRASLVSGRWLTHLLRSDACKPSTLMSRTCRRALSRAGVDRANHAETIPAGEHRRPAPSPIRPRRHHECRHSIRCPVQLCDLGPLLATPPSEGTAKLSCSTDPLPNAVEPTH